MTCRMSAAFWTECAAFHLAPPRGGLPFNLHVAKNNLQKTVGVFSRLTMYTQANIVGTSNGNLISSFASHMCGQQANPSNGGLFCFMGFMFIHSFTSHHATPTVACRLTSTTFPWQQDTNRPLQLRQLEEVGRIANEKVRHR